MKANILLLSLVIILSCRQEETPIKQIGHVQFSLGARLSGGRSTEVATPAFVLLSMEDNQGNVLFSKRELPLYVFGNSYMSESIELAYGDYSITEFLVLDAAKHVLYACPREGSDFAHLVGDPLPIEVTVSDEIITVSPQVLAVTGTEVSEAFGYAGFGFDVVTPKKSVKIKVNVRLMIGAVLYDNVDAKIKVSGFNSVGEQKWQQEFNYVGPVDNEIAIESGHDHYTIEMFKWGMQDQRTFSAKELEEKCIGGTSPMTWVLSGNASARKLKYTIEVAEQAQSNGVSYMMIESKTEYFYDAAGKLTSKVGFGYSAVTDKFEPSGFLTAISYQNGKVNRISNFHGNGLLSTYDYFYFPDGRESRIVEKNSASGLNSEVNLTYNMNDRTIKAIFTYSNGSGFEYEFFYDWRNIVSDRTTRWNNLCSEGSYSYDKNINPFKHFGYLDYGVTNYSINNKLTESVKYIACVFPTLTVDHVEYNYDQYGYPVVSTTYYKTTSGKLVKRMTVYEYY